MKTLQNIKEIIGKNKKLLGYYNVKEIGVFGSYARGDSHGKSDIDILVELSPTIGLFQFVELEHRLETLLGRHIDLATKNALKPRIKDRILEQMVYV